MKSWAPDLKLTRKGIVISEYIINVDMNSDIEIYKRHAADEHCDLGTDLTSPEAQTISKMFMMMNIRQ